MTSDDNIICDDSAVNNSIHESDIYDSTLTEDGSENISASSFRHIGVHVADINQEGIGDIGDGISDAASTLCKIKSQNLNRPLLGHLNMNGISNKFESLKTLIEGKIDIFVVSETKIDSSFPSSQFSLDGFAEPLRRDRNIHGGGVLMYYRNDLHFKEVKPISFPADVEVIFAELTLRKAKWLIVGGYNPDKI